MNNWSVNLWYDKLFMPDFTTMSCVTKTKTTYNKDIDTFALLPMPQELEIVEGNLTLSVLGNEPEIIIDPLVITKPQSYQLVFNNLPFLSIIKLWITFH